MQKTRKKNTLGPKRRQMRRLGPFSFLGLPPALAAVSFVLASVGLRWPSLDFVGRGCCGASLAAVDPCWPALAAVGLHSPSLAAVGRRCGPLWASSGPKVGIWVCSG